MLALRSRRHRPNDNSANLLPLLEHAPLELIPMKSLERAIGELPSGSSVSMTCSPAKSIEATLDESERLIALGHSVTPHLSARMVRSPEHLAEIHSRLVELDIRNVFVVGGDADPPGCFFDAIEFLHAFLELDDERGIEQRQVEHIGFTAYPDSHPFITNEQLHQALHAKQQLIIATGRTAHATTQMCFSADQIVQWLRRERAAGLVIPVHIGVAGVIDTGRLMTMGLRLGVGTSLRYLSKNRRAIGKLVSKRAYQPDALLRPLAASIDDLGVGGIHLYTFNQVEPTERWRSRFVAAPMPTRRRRH